MKFEIRYKVMLFIVLSIMLLLYLTLNLMSDVRLKKDNYNTDELNVSNTKELEIQENKIFPAYVFANSDGDKLITFIENKDITPVQEVNHVISKNGIFKINYLGYQESKSTYNHRETMYEFDNMPGHIFSIEDGVVFPNETCLLINKDYFPLESVLEIREQNNVEMSYKLLSSIENERKCKVKKGWILARGDSWDVGLVQFEKKENDMLASIILITNNGLIFKDYPAQYDEQSTWRLEDYAEIDPIMFRINFVAQDDEGYLICVSWSSYESEAVFLLKEKDGLLIDLNIDSGRYILPM